MLQAFSSVWDRGIDITPLLAKNCVMWLHDSVRMGREVWVHGIIMMGLVGIWYRLKMAGLVGIWYTVRM